MKGGYGRRNTTEVLKADDAPTGQDVGRGKTKLWTQSAKW